jgi:glycosyltransferase involved in cell wall biosynthesis
MKKNVLVYKSDLLPYSETFIKEQVLACARWRPVLVGRYRVDGVPLDGLDVQLLCAPKPARWRTNAWKLLREMNLAPPGVVERLRREKASLVHVHFGTEAVAIWPALERLGLPVAVTLHGSDINIHREWWEQPTAGIASRGYPRRLLDLGRHPKVHFIAVSHAVRERAIGYGLPADRVSVRYIGIDLDRFKPAATPVTSRPRRILFVGRMVEKKGGAHVIDAFAALRARLPDAELVMVGDGPLMPALMARAAELNAPVQFRGSLSSDAVRRELDQARVFCLPSVTATNGDAEGLPIVVMEAQACGVPVVTSARGGATEGIAHGRTGFAFAEHDVAALTAALERVLSDDALADRMSAEAVAFARERFDIRFCTAALESLYDELAVAA